MIDFDRTSSADPFLSTVETLSCAIPKNALFESQAIPVRHRGARRDLLSVGVEWHAACMCVDRSQLLYSLPIVEPTTVNSTQLSSSCGGSLFLCSSCSQLSFRSNLINGLCQSSNLRKQASETNNDAIELISSQSCRCCRYFVVIRKSHCLLRFCASARRRRRRLGKIPRSLQPEQFRRGE